MMIRGIRGATTVEHDTEQEILEKTQQLLEKIIEENQTKAEDVVQILLSATPDLHSVFPAKAVRRLSGWQYVPVTCMQEMDVNGGLKKCIRVMMTVQTDTPQDEIRHVYLEKAVVLRPDLSLTKNAEL
ncbi:chorismate mutase [Bacillus nakamurai]|uniref:chorismate mutase n=1 Tax=Bacillus nakamurai TaxID=1793963 RepID=A0A150FAB5_9BACI|nr:chorismate mutase [Bacillus nakamurai]KXZ21588.1 chorismate mutase [Bacillus nakamurai]KXZ22013.1 chorismate mutase [Bacillus nakamurai]MCC9021027.1 chorismate mutase [Bacillus nakamurai]MCP6681263.1 chorismate mutase [Bacillus nakamurai]MED1229252.1 chorismate mutase [Bacillus nakamurai]